MSAPAFEQAPPRWLGTVLFMAMSLFLWVSINPFVDLTGEAILDPSAGRSDRLNQIVFLSLTASLIGWAFFHPMRNAVLQSRVLLTILFTWFLAVSLIAAHPMLGVKGVVLAVLTTANASIYLILPSSERHFARMMGIVMLTMLALSYYGVVFKPTLSIHQASELREPMNAGMWRGHFAHKNSAAAAMALAIFFGLYVIRAWSMVAGLAIVVLAGLFLTHTGGKTSSAMVPLIITLAFVFEKMRWLRIPLVVGGVALFNLLAVGSAVWDAFGRFVADLGIDATFTNRTDIWRFAFDAIAERPLTGHGFRGFWQTEDLVHGGATIETWAAAAANGHNSYLDIALTTGIPGLALTLCWLIVLPLRDVSRMAPAQEKSPLTRLFVRIWLFSLLNAGLESLFFEGGSFVWFTLLAALCGLRLQATATLTAEDVPQRARLERPAHA